MDAAVLVVVVIPEGSLRVTSLGRSLLQENQIPVGALLSPGAPEAQLQEPGKVCGRNKGNKGSRCSVGALSGFLLYRVALGWPG